MGNFTRKVYHSRQRTHDALSGRHAGIELEINHNRGYNRLLELLPDTPPGQDTVDVEMDGSLPLTTGAEIIFPPIKYGEVKRDTSYIAKAFKSLGDGGAGAPTTRFGMHININTREWSRRQMQLFVAVINSINPLWLQHVGGRALTAYCLQRPEARLLHYDSDGVMLRPAAHIRGRWTRIECRFPKATTDIKRVRMLLEFFELVEQFSKSEVRYNAIDRKLQRVAFLTERKAVVDEAFRSWMLRLRSPKAVKVREVLLNGY